MLRFDLAGWGALVLRMGYERLAQDGLRLAYARIRGTAGLLAHPASSFGPGLAGVR